MAKRKEILNAIREMDDTTLKNRVIELKKELFALRTLAKREGKTNPGKIREVKREIAQIMTELRSRELKRKEQEKTKEREKVKAITS